MTEKHLFWFLGDSLYRYRITRHDRKVKKDSLYVLAQITVCNWYKSGDKKTVRREGIEPIKRFYIGYT